MPAQGLLHQKTTLNWGASESPEGITSHRQGSRSLETGQYPARVNRSSAAATEPNSKTAVSLGLGTSIAPSLDSWLDSAVEVGPSLGFSSPVFLRLQKSKPIFFLSA
eukprot:Gb_11753 [translate_table: standard]